jgi:hypothetical protein
MGSRKCIHYQSSRGRVSPPILHVLRWCNYLWFMLFEQQQIQGKIKNRGNFWDGTWASNGIKNCCSELDGPWSILDFILWYFSYRPIHWNKYDRCGDEKIHKERSSTGSGISNRNVCKATRWWNVLRRVAPHNKKCLGTAKCRTDRRNNRLGWCLERISQLWTCSLDDHSGHVNHHSRRTRRESSYHGSACR